MNEQPILSNADLFSNYESSAYHVFMAYDVVPAGHRAMNLMQEITQELNGTSEIKPHLWRMDLLDLPELFEVAATEASRSALVIISTYAEDGLTPAIRRLLKSCVTPANGTDVTVIGLVGPDDDSEEAAGMNFKFIMSNTRSAEEDFQKREEFELLPNSEESFENNILSPKFASFQKSNCHYN